MKSAKPHYDSLLPEIEKGNYVPKNIFQIALSPKKRNGRFSSNMLCGELLNNQSKLQKDNPGWNYNCFGNDEAERFIKEAYGDIILTYYRRINVAYGAARADFLRYLLVYYYGGVYLDIKCRCIIPLDNIIPSTGLYVLPDDEQWAHSEFLDMNGKFYFNAFIVAPQGHPLLKSIILEMLKRIDSYNPYEDGVGWRGVVTTTGTYMYSKVINSYIADMNTDYVFANARKDYGYVNIYQSPDGKV